MTVYGYIRVSTEKQTSANQRFEIERHLLNKGIAVDKWINETVSGAVSFKKRRLGIALRRFQKNDILICSELSRLGRSILDVLLMQFDRLLVAPSVFEIYAARRRAASPHAIRLPRLKFAHFI